MPVCPAPGDNPVSIKAMPFAGQRQRPREVKKKQLLLAIIGPGWDIAANFADFSLEVAAMIIGGPIAHSPEQRGVTRVIFTRKVKLFVRGALQGTYPARNLSLGGLFVEGALDVPQGENCRLELHETGLHSSLILTFFGTIARREADGVGVQFTRMEEDSFMFLQTMVLYSSDEPIGVAEQFLETFVPHQSSSV